jgi:hypothetical protein
LISQIISEIIVPSHSHILHQLLFTPKGWLLIEKYFTGSLGAFSGQHKGSFLFWGVDKKGHRIHLQHEDDRIKGVPYSLKLDPEAISQALKQRELYPTSLVCFLTLLYYQFTCLGGFNQVNWLTNIKEKFLKLLEEIGEKELADKIKSVETKNFAEGNLTFLFNQDKFYQATGIDLYLTGKDWYQKYQNLAGELTLGESIESGLPEIYKIITLADQRKEELLAINHQDIAKFNGMEQKIRKFLF